MILATLPRTAPAAVIGSGSFGDMPTLGWTPTLVAQRNCAAVTLSGWLIQSQSNLAALTDLTTPAAALGAPVSAPTVLRETTPNGKAGGESATEHIYEGDVGFSSRRVLRRDAILFEAGWNWHPTGTNKLGFIWPASVPRCWVCAWGSIASSIFFGVGLQNLFSWQGDTSPDAQTLGAGGPEAAKVTEGEWSVVWTECTGNTAGQEDARVRQWVDVGAGPVLTLDVTDFAFSAGAALIDRVDFGTMRGGAGTSNPSACFAQFDDMTIWQEAA